MGIYPAYLCASASLRELILVAAEGRAKVSVVKTPGSSGRVAETGRSLAPAAAINIVIIFGLCDTYRRPEASLMRQGTVATALAESHPVLRTSMLLGAPPQTPAFFALRQWHIGTARREGGFERAWNLPAGRPGSRAAAARTVLESALLCETNQICGSRDGTHDAAAGIGFVCTAGLHPGGKTAKMAGRWNWYRHFGKEK
jgi:hypothetical protein